MDKEYYESYFDLEEQHWWFRARREIVLSILKKYFRNDLGQAKILDFGCGSGSLVSYFQERGASAFGVDRETKAIGYGRSKGVANLSVMEDQNINFDNGSFDLVLALDVLEHIQDDTWPVKEIERVLSKNGLAIITVPACQFLWGVQDEVSHHYRRYTLSQLAQLIKENTELNIVKKTYFNSLLFLPIALIRLLSRRKKGIERKSDFEIGSSLTNRIGFRIFRIERELLKYINLPFGVSAMVVLRKDV